MINDFIGYYLCVVNAVAFLMYGMDKQKAKRRKWRIPEATLLGIAAAGGSIGAWIGMKTFHHKTKHLIFQIGVPVLICIHVCILMYFVFK